MRVGVQIMYNDLNKLITAGPRHHPSHRMSHPHMLDSMKRSGRDFVVEFGPVVRNLHDEGLVVKDPPHGTRRHSSPNRQGF